MNDPLPLVVANLKANQTWQDLAVWLDLVIQKAQEFTGTVVVCPSAPFIGSAHQKINSSGAKLRLGIQDISQFDQGPYTGEVAASQIAGLCQYAIIGHSERRQNFNQTDEVVERKFQRAQDAGLSAIFCTTGPDIMIPEGVQIVAYEPITAIGTGNPDTPQNALSVAEKLKAKNNYTVLYGGSVTGENVAGFLKKGTVDGVLVGTASLDPASMSDIIESATS